MSLVCIEKCRGSFHLEVTLKQQTGLCLLVLRCGRRERMALSTEGSYEVCAQRNAQCWTQTCPQLRLAFPTHFPDSLLVCFSYLHITTTWMVVGVSCYTFSEFGVSGLLQPASDE